LNRQQRYSGWLFSERGGQHNLVASESWTTAPEPENVGRIRREVVGYAAQHGVPEPPLADLAVAVSEAVTNAVVHAFRNGIPAEGTVKVEVEVTAGQVAKVVVSDDGEGMTPRPDTPGLGLGLPLMAQLASSFTVTGPLDGSGTEVCMTFDLAGAAAA
jgi:anti-sigma regulatory factor (Ser/Thr protein kinase)